jgi:hypothetical protein
VATAASSLRQRGPGGLQTPGSPRASVNHMVRPIFSPTDQSRSVGFTFLN